jgi:aldose 1-epimerase
MAWLACTWPLPNLAPRGRALASEPMTCAPNALQSGDGLRRLPPGELLTSSWRIAASCEWSGGP